LDRTTVLKETAAKQAKPSNFIIFEQNNIVYFTNFSGGAALLIPEDGENTLYVGSVNYEQAKAEVKGSVVELLERNENLMEKIAKQVPNKRLSVDTLPIERWQSLAKAVGGEEKLDPAKNLICELRKIKDPQEIHLIREACKLADIGIQAASETIQSGRKEKEVAAEIEYAIRKAGSNGTAFKTIVASGPYSAFPHGSNLEKTIHEGDFVVVDLGASYKSYQSDITRTFIVGRSTEKQRRIYETVKLANQRAFETIRPGVFASDVDMAARRVIKTAGLSKFFVHNLGHGVGLDVHEAPILSPDSKEILFSGNVVTNEPGIYIPDFGGVRIEDTLLVTRDGAEKLTLSSYTT
jgi:Xaa-Pro dipeptidase